MSTVDNFLVNVNNSITQETKKNNSFRKIHMGNQISHNREVARVSDKTKCCRPHTIE